MCFPQLAGANCKRSNSRAAQQKAIARPAGTETIKDFTATIREISSRNLRAAGGRLLWERLIAAFVCRLFEDFESFLVAPQSLDGSVGGIDLGFLEAVVISDAAVEFATAFRFTGKVALQ